LGVIFYKKSGKNFTVAKSGKDRKMRISKTNTAVFTVILGVFLISGCVPQDKYEDLRLQNRTQLERIGDLESNYNAIKLQFEEQLLSLQDDSFEVVILRLATLFGLAPRMRFDIAVNIMTLRAWRDHEIHVGGGGRGLSILLGGGSRRVKATLPRPNAAHVAGDRQ